MFVITTPESNRRYHERDIVTAADVILGLTGDDEERDRALIIMGNMCFDSVFDVWDKYTIVCIPEEEAGD